MKEQGKEDIIMLSQQTRTGGHRMNMAFRRIIMKFDYSIHSSPIIDKIQLRESLGGYVEYHLNISSQNGTPIL